MRNPFRVALINLDILGLHSDWCANFTLFARVDTECANDIVWFIVWVGGGGLAVVVIGRVHRSVDGSLCPRKIRLP